MADRDVINSKNGEDYDGNIYKFLSSNDKNNHDRKALASVYYTALGRERYGMYRTFNNNEVLKEEYK